MSEDFLPMLEQPPELREIPGDYDVQIPLRSPECAIASDVSTQTVLLVYFRPERFTDVMGWLYWLGFHLQYPCSHMAQGELGAILEGNAATFTPQTRSCLNFLVGSGLLLNFEIYAPRI